MPFPFPSLFSLFFIFSKKPPSPSSPSSPPSSPSSPFPLFSTPHPQLQRSRSRRRSSCRSHHVHIHIDVPQIVIERRNSTWQEARRKNPDIDPMDWITSLDCTEAKEELFRTAVENLAKAMRERGRKGKGNKKRKGKRNGSEGENNGDGDGDGDGKEKKERKGGLGRLVRRLGQGLGFGVGKVKGEKHRAIMCVENRQGRTTRMSITIMRDVRS